MLLRFIIALIIACIALLLGAIIGGYGAWYFSWFLGTGFMILVAVSAGVLFEAQEAAVQDASDTASEVGRIVTGASSRGRAK